MSTCIIDGKTTGDGYQLCYSCGEQLEYDLAEVSGVLADLGVVVTRKAKGAPSVGGGGTTENPLPLDLDAMGKGRAMVELLRSWYWMILEPLESSYDTECARIAKMPFEDQPDCPEWPGCREYRSVGPLSDWLRSHMAHIRKHEWGADMKHEVRDALNQCRRASDRAAERIDVGECGAVNDDIPCPERLTARNDQALTQCRTCGAVWDVKERQRAAILSAWNHLDTMPTILRALKTYDVHIKPKDAENWVRLQHLTPVTTYGKVKLYRVSDVYEVHTRMMQRRRKTRAA